MIELDNPALFLVATIALLVMPGPAVLYIVATSLDRGRRAGMMSTLGISVGTLVHVTAAALGVSAILMTSAAAYTAVKFVGAGYLLFLGIQRMCQRVETSSETVSTQGNLWHAFWRGAAVNTLNPETALFFFAFLPQFVDPSHGHVAVQIAVLGAGFHECTCRNSRRRRRIRGGNGIEP